MTFSEAMRLAPCKKELPHRNASGRFTGRGSFVVHEIRNDKIVITCSRGTQRTILEKDWNEVQDNLQTLKVSGKVRQILKTRNATYVLSLMAYYADRINVGSTFS